jgi:hypothetical protein
MITIVHIILLATLFFWLRKKYPQPIFSIALLSKVTAGLSLGLLYLYYYSTGDTWTYHADASKILNWLLSDVDQTVAFFWNSYVPDQLNVSGATQPRALFFLKWIVVFYFFTGCSYWLTSIYFSLISFWASWRLTQALSSAFPKAALEICLGLLVIPSVFFWSSGIVKESLAFAGLLFLTTFFVRSYFANTFKYNSMGLILICLWVLWNLKYYWLAVWLVAVVPLLLQRLVLTKFSIAARFATVTWLLIFLLSIGGATFLHPNFYKEHLVIVIVDSYRAFAALSTAGDYIQYPNLVATWLSILQNAPWALISGLFRPFIWEANNLLQLLSAIENTVLVIVLGWLYYKNWNKLSTPVWLLAIVVYILILATFLALSTPNFGSLSRFRIAFTPFLWMLVLSGVEVSRFMPNWMKRLLQP